MKKPHFVIVLALVCLMSSFAGHAYAGPRNTPDIGREYMATAQDLRNWSVGIYTERTDREIEFRKIDYRLSTEEIMMILGYDLADWLGFYAIGGNMKTEVGKDSGFGDSKAKWGVGLNANLLHHDIMDAMLYEDRIFINATIQYAWMETERFRADVEWEEISGSLTASVVNDIEGNKLYLPKSIALFGGLAYSNLDGDDIDEKDTVGLTGGMEVFFSEKVILYTSVTRFDASDKSFTVGLTARF